VATSPTQRTLEALRKAGYTVDVVERFNSFTKQRKDFLGFVDLIAVGDGETIGVQACITGDQSTRAKKIIEACSDNAQAWLRGGNRIQVWGWAKRGARGRAKRWTSSVREITAADFPQSRTVH
jgi:hypothetical protein